ncbi:MAG TPA: orotidine-5'-phosphate decarboxylase [Candidatus Saccharimonadales bacterium]|nr:orotidine-5'-phosphate decarboxylase [Candidatus Saccharimonadales bacterium]
MDFKSKLDEAVEKNSSLVCVGLDPDPDKLPEEFKAAEKPLFEFNKSIIDATHDSVCAYKPNSAFYEALGVDGIEQLKATCDYIRENYPDIPIILDYKRGDIGNTNAKYAQFAFEYLGADAVTLQPYQGGEALQPFLEYKDKGIIILAKTSNDGSAEFQNLQTEGKPLYEHVAEKAVKEWNMNGNIGLVAGATYPEELKRIREIAGEDTIILVPGIGAQGGDLEVMLKAGLNGSHKGLIINSSRGIIYSDNPAQTAAELKTQVGQLR